MTRRLLTLLRAACLATLPVWSGAHTHGAAPPATDKRIDLRHTESGQVADYQKSVIFL